MSTLLAFEAFAIEIAVWHGCVRYGEVAGR